MWTVIGFKLAQEGEEFVRIYDDSTEKIFSVQQDANEYGSYLLSKSIPFIDIYEKELFNDGELDITALKREDALNKLTPEEKYILGL